MSSSYLRPQHRRIQRILQALDADLLLRFECLFGGGTAISMAMGEYRESIDVDFIVSSVDGYRELRSIVGSVGIQGILRSGLATPPLVRREPRIDQYGIRCALQLDEDEHAQDRPVKLEIVFEGRVQLAAPSPGERIEGIWSLASEDKVATKLMANADRWADDSVCSRDLIDLAMLTGGGRAEPAGVAKAFRAYGRSALVDFERAREKLLGRQDWLATCMKRMKMSMPEQELRDKIASMIVDLPSPDHPVPRGG